MENYFCTIFLILFKINIEILIFIVIKYRCTTYNLSNHSTLPQPAYTQTQTPLQDISYLLILTIPHTFGNSQHHHSNPLVPSSSSLIPIIPNIKPILYTHFPCTSNIPSHLTPPVLFPHTPLSSISIVSPDLSDHISHQWVPITPFTLIIQYLTPLLPVSCLPHHNLSPTFYIIPHPNTAYRTSLGLYPSHLHASIFSNTSHPLSRHLTPISPPLSLKEK